MNAVTREDADASGVPEAQLIGHLVEAIVLRDEKLTASLVNEGEARLGAQSLMDVIAIISGFNGITKIANAVGLPLDESTEDMTKELRAETGIDAFWESEC